MASMHWPGLPLVRKGGGDWWMASMHWPGLPLVRKGG